MNDQYFDMINIEMKGITTQMRHIESKTNNDVKTHVCYYLSCVGPWFTILVPRWFLGMSSLDPAFSNFKET